MIIVLCLLAFLLLAVNGQVFPSLLTRIGGSSIEQGFFLSSLFFFFPLSSIAAGYFADRSSKTLIIGIGLILMALAFIFNALFESIQARTLSVLLFGLGGGAVESQAAALLADTNPGRERSVMNLSQTFFSIGAAAGPFLIVLIYQLQSETSLPAILWTASVFPILLTVFFMLARKRRVYSDGFKPPGFNMLLKNRDLRLLSIIIFLYVATEMGTAGWLAKYGELHLALSAKLAPLCITIFWAGMGISRAFVGILPSGISNRSLLSGAMFFTLAAQVLTFSTTHLVMALTGIGLIGFGMGTVWPTLVAIIGSRFRRSSGTAIGIVVAAGGMGIPFIQSVIGYLSNQKVLGLRISLMALGLLTFLNILLFLFVLNDR